MLWLIQPLNMWLRSLFHEMRVILPILMKMYCNNQSAIFIASNPMFHERTKHIEVDCHFVCDLMIIKYIVTPYVQSEDQLGDILTKSLTYSPFFALYKMLGMFDLYTPA